MTDKVEPGPNPLGENDKSKPNWDSSMKSGAEPMEVPVKENIDPTEFPGEEGPSQGAGDGKVKAGGNVAEGMGTSLSCQVQVCKG
ncbi:unnamed protein product [Allacma fusca]|uniref:Uncharacterized protein n=1 Tax=Allacma fusca TaxID=39272 RepID=A0A8J2KGL8_9HEXA|nr:unnamed protein product [Allacma fusca]